MSSKNDACLIVFLVAISTWPTVQGFNVGVTGTTCNLDPNKGDVTNVCPSFYDAECDGRHCFCPAGTHEDPGLKRCVPGEAPKPKVSSGGTHAAGGGGDPLDDLPWDYEPNKKTTPKPSAPAGPPPQQPPPGPPPHPQPGYPNQPRNPGQPQPGYPQPGYPQPGYPSQPQPPPGSGGTRPGSKGSQGVTGTTCNLDPRKGDINNVCPSFYNAECDGRHCFCPAGTHEDPGLKRCVPGKAPKHAAGDGNVGEKAGGSVGGIIGLLIVGGLFYYCCCRGGKHKEVMNRFQGIPFIGGRQQAVPGQAVQMQQSPPVQQDPNFGSQHTYVPPGGGAPVDPGQYPPPQQQYPPAGGYYPVAPGPPYAQQPGYAPYPPPGFVPDGQQPPPYTQQYQPNAPPPQ